MPTNRPATLHWASQSELSVGDVSFFATSDPAIYRTRVSDERSFLICKSKDMIEREFAILAQAPTTNIVEIGIWQGGSVALLDRVFQPNKLVAIEHSKRELPALDAYIKARGREANVRLKCGIDQSDRSKMEAILASEFGTEPIDIVIDDASHLYEESIASFNVLFPRLRPNGLYIIEDWGWSTKQRHYEANYFRGRLGLSNLVVQCMLVCTQRPDIIKSMTIFPGFVTVVRGNCAGMDEIDLAKFATNKGVPVASFL